MMSITMLYLGYDGTMVEYINDPEKSKAVVEEARDHLIANKDMVRNYYDSGAEVHSQRDS